MEQKLFRVRSIAIPDADAEAWAAVAAILRQGDFGPEVFLIKRAENPNDPWSGHVALPGGRREAHDGTLLDTAIRETREEVGIHLDDDAKVWGALDDMRAHSRGQPTGLIVRPFVFGLSDAIDVPTGRASVLDILDHEEVAESFWAPIPPMLRGEASTKRDYILGGQPVELPAFSVAGHVVWGMTYYILASLFSRLG
ncbi:MAG: CoA pyrophosphatase [Polyangiales bacterium]